MKELTYLRVIPKIHFPGIIRVTLECSVCKPVHAGMVIVSLLQHVVQAWHLQGTSFVNFL